VLRQDGLSGARFLIALRAFAPSREPIQPAVRITPTLTRRPATP